MKNNRTQKEIFAKNLRNALAHRNKTQVEIAEALETSQSNVSKWVNGIQYPRIETIRELANVLHLPLAALTEEIVIKGYDLFFGDNEDLFDSMIFDEVLSEINKGYGAIDIFENFESEDIFNNERVSRSVPEFRRALTAHEKSKLYGYKLNSEDIFFDNSYVLFEVDVEFKDKDIVIARLKNKEIIIGTVVFLEDNILINLSEDKNITRTFRRDEISLLGKVHLIVKVLR